jgi:beta-aspartyl-peptidase (threonine type)
VAYSPEEHAGRHEAIASALRVGRSILSAGGTSLEAARCAVCVLEDAPGFNAGRGAALTHEGFAELDASIMEGRQRRVGAVAGLRRVKNPIDLASRVMERSEHVFLMGEGAECFAVREGVTLIDPGYFVTDRQSRALRQIIESESTDSVKRAEMSGTVGAVALDMQGDLSAATSTGGIPNKRHGRVGDTPIIGAGTYAENGVCAVSATGWGEYFIRNAAAHDVCARMKYTGKALDFAAAEVLDEVVRMGGYGGMIAIDASGNLTMPFSTPTMPHGYVVPDDEKVISFGAA